MTTPISGPVSGPERSEAERKVVAGGSPQEAMASRMPKDPLTVQKILDVFKKVRKGAPDADKELAEFQANYIDPLKDQGGSSNARLVADKIFEFSLKEVKKKEVWRQIGSCLRKYLRQCTPEEFDEEKAKHFKEIEKIFEALKKEYPSESEEISRFFNARVKPFEGVWSYQHHKLLIIKVGVEHSGGIWRRIIRELRGTSIYPPKKLMAKIKTSFEDKELRVLRLISVQHGVKLYEYDNPAALEPLKFFDAGVVQRNLRQEVLEAIQRTKGVRSAEANNVRSAEVDKVINNIKDLITVVEQFGSEKEVEWITFQVIDFLSFEELPERHPLISFLNTPLAEKKKFLQEQIDIFAKQKNGSHVGGINIEGLSQTPLKATLTGTMTNLAIQKEKSLKAIDAYLSNQNQLTFEDLKALIRQVERNIPYDPYLTNLKNYLTDILNINYHQILQGLDVLIKDAFDQVCELIIEDSRPLTLEDVKTHLKFLLDPKNQKSAEILLEKIQKENADFSDEQLKLEADLKLLLDHQKQPISIEDLIAEIKQKIEGAIKAGTFSIHYIFFLIKLDAAKQTILAVKKAVDLAKMDAPLYYKTEDLIPHLKLSLNDPIVVNAPLFITLHQAIDTFRIPLEKAVKIFRVPPENIAKIYNVPFEVARKLLAAERDSKKVQAFFSEQDFNDLVKTHLSKVLRVEPAVLKKILAKMLLKATKTQATTENYAFELSAPRAELAHDIASILNCSEIFLQKQRQTLAGMSVEGMKNPVGLISRRIAEEMPRVNLSAYLELKAQLAAAKFKLEEFEKQQPKETEAIRQKKEEIAGMNKRLIKLNQDVQDYAISAARNSIEELLQQVVRDLEKQTKELIEVNISPQSIDAYIREKAAAKPGEQKVLFEKLQNQTVGQLDTLDLRVDTLDLREIIQERELLLEKIRKLEGEFKNVEALYRSERENTRWSIQMQGLMDICLGNMNGRYEQYKVLNDGKVVCTGFNAFGFPEDFYYTWNLKDERVISPCFSSVMVDHPYAEMPLHEKMVATIKMWDLEEIRKDLQLHQAKAESFDEFVVLNTDVVPCMKMIDLYCRKFFVKDISEQTFTKYEDFVKAVKKQLTLMQKPLAENKGHLEKALLAVNEKIDQQGEELEKINEKLEALNKELSELDKLKKTVKEEDSVKKSAIEKHISARKDSIKNLSEERGLIEKQIMELNQKSEKLKNELALAQAAMDTRTIMKKFEKDPHTGRIPMKEMFKVIEKMSNSFRGGFEFALAKKERLESICRRTLHPKAVNSILARLTACKNLVTQNPKISIKELFEHIFPEYQLFYKIIERNIVYFRGGQTMGPGVSLTHDAKKNTLGTLEDAIKTMRQNQIVSEAELKRMEELLERLRKETQYSNQLLELV